MRKTSTLFLFGLIPALAFSGELRFQCPERYPNKLIELTEQPDGWSGATAILSSSVLVSGGGMITGSPKDEPRAELRGTESRNKNGVSETRYPVAGPETWLFCSYGQGGEVKVFRQIVGADLKECSVKLTRPKWPATVQVNVACK